MCGADYVSGGEMFTHLYQREHFTEDEVRIYIGEIVLALETLHKVTITHYIVKMCYFLLWLVIIIVDLCSYLTFINK